MKPEIKIDTRQWIAAAKALKETSSRTTVDFINGQAFRVATLAVKETPHADAGKISRQLGAVARTVSFKVLSRGVNKGKRRTVRGDYILASKDTLAHRILTQRKLKTGSFHMHGESMDEKATNLIRARIASVNFIRAAWIPVIRKLGSVVRRKPSKVASVSGVKQRGVDKGFSTPAVFRLASVIRAEIGVALFKKPVHPETAGNPIRTATVGLQKALNVASKDMIDELASRLNPDFKKASAK